MEHGVCSRAPVSVMGFVEQVVPYPAALLAADAAKLRHALSAGLAVPRHFCACEVIAGPLDQHFAHERQVVRFCGPLFACKCGQVPHRPKVRHGDLLLQPSG